MKLESSVTLFDDNKVEDRFAELQITADGITAEVGRKVGNDEVISRINQSAESIQIQANKVNIEGATIFSSGRLSQNSLNNAYDANGAATGAVNGLKNDLSSSSGTTVINGGHITTGTLSAGAVNATSGTFNVANIPDLNASKITAGKLSADRINVSEINIGAAQITSGTINTARIPNLDASKITTGTLSADRIGATSIAIGKLDTNAQNTIDNAGKTASSFITPSGNTGITVHAINNPTSNYVQIDNNGMDVVKSGASIGYFKGDTARIGQSSTAHVDLTSSSISMSDGTRTIYEVAQSSTAVKVTKIYNVTQSLGDSGFTDTIGLGRTVSNWTSIVLTYKVNSTTYTKSYSSLPIYDSSGGYAFNAELNGTTIKIDWFAGLTATASTKYTLVSVVFNFTTSQQVVESTLGAFANKTQSGVFRVGTGTANNALANGMLVDWGGNVRAGGDIVAYSNADSSGGVSLAKPTIIPYAYSYGSGSNSVTIGMYRVGKVVMLHIYFSKSSSTASGSNLFSINLSGAQFPEPAIDKLYGISGSTFYGAHAIGFLLIEDETASGIADDDPMGWYKLVIRNASNSAVTASGVGEGTLMYICK